MADSTAFIDTTTGWDATTFIYVDDSTSTLSVAETQMVDSLLSNFDAVAGSICGSSDKVQKDLDGIIGAMSSINPNDYTPTNLMDDFTRQALDQAYNTAAWTTGADALSQLTGIKSQCALLNPISSGLPKYGDISRMAESLREGAVTAALGAITSVAASFQSEIGRGVAELSAGSKLGETVNTGASAFDEVKTQATEAVSSVLETGKAGLAKAQSVMSKLSGPLKLLDQISNCASSVGGADFAGEIDGMLDTVSDCYAKMYMYNDPSDPSFGEFNQTAFIDDIPAVPLAVVDNTLKVANLYNKATNNANLSIDKLVEQAKPGAKSTSSLRPNNETVPVETKRINTEEETKIEVEVPKVPAAPGREAEPSTVVDAPDPTPVATPTNPDEPNVVPPGILVAYTQSLRIIQFDDSGSAYFVFDPNDKAVPAYKTSAQGMIPDGGRQLSDEDKDKKYNINIIIRTITVRTKLKGPRTTLPDGSKEFNKFAIFESLVSVDFIGEGGFADFRKTGHGVSYSTPVPRSQYSLPDDVRTDLAIQCIKSAFAKMDPVTKEEMDSITYF